MKKRTSKERCHCVWMREGRKDPPVVGVEEVNNQNVLYEKKSFR